VPLTEDAWVHYLPFLSSLKNQFESGDAAAVNFNGAKTLDFYLRKNGNQIVMNIKIGYPTFVNDTSMYYFNPTATPCEYKADPFEPFSPPQILQDKGNYYIYYADGSSSGLVIYIRQA
jgi:hypothetical protein